jgi:hypothetical protein
MHVKCANTEGTAQTADRLGEHGFLLDRISQWCQVSWKLTVSFVGEDQIRVLRVRACSGPPL